MAMNRARKGSSFEREICTKLSLWWTQDLKEPRDDIFWRSSQSGGRATERSKKGKTTYGSYGDIAALDPIGAPLLKMFTIELKRGSSHGSPGDLLDFKEQNQAHAWVKCLHQTISSHLAAGSFGWMMICRRDHRCAVCFIDLATYRRFHRVVDLFPCVRYRLKIFGELVDFLGLPLDLFLDRTSPQEIIQMIK
jgi:hypothetical protein